MTLGAAPLFEVARRIRRSIAAGQQLEGLKFYETFESRNEGYDHLPRVMIMDYSDKEEIAGPPPADDLSGNGINTSIRLIPTISLQLVVCRDNGWLSADSETRIQKMGAIIVKNLLIDEIERNDEGIPDCTLNGTLEKPPLFSCRESGIFDLGMVMDIAIQIPGIRMGRCERSYIRG